MLGRKVKEYVLNKWVLVLVRVDTWVKYGV